MNKLGNTRYKKTITNAAELEDTIAEVAFVGRSNVGKSSVLNAVCGKNKLARTSQRPGQTRTINIYSAGDKRWIVDLPGYGYASGSKDEIATWGGMIEGYLLSRPSLRAVFMIVDGNVGATKLDTQMARWLGKNGIPYCVVANKCDKISVPEQEERRRAVADAMDKRPEDVRWVSATKNLGIRELQLEVGALLKL